VHEYWKVKRFLLGRTLKKIFLKNSGNKNLTGRRYQWHNNKMISFYKFLKIRTGEAVKTNLSVSYHMENGKCLFFRKAIHMPL